MTELEQYDEKRTRKSWNKHTCIQTFAFNFGFSRSHGLTKRLTTVLKPSEAANGKRGHQLSKALERYSPHGPLASG